MKKSLSLLALLTVAGLLHIMRATQATINGAFNVINNVTNVATEEWWHGKWVRVPAINTSDITLSAETIDGRQCITVHNAIGGLTDIVFGNYNGSLDLKDKTQYTFTLADGTTRTYWAQKCERGDYDCYMVPFYGFTSNGNGSNVGTAKSYGMSNSPTSATATDVTAFVISSESTRHLFYICDPGTLNVRDTREYWGVAIRSMMVNGTAMSMYTNEQADNPVTVMKVYPVHTGLTDTKIQGNIDEDYPDYTGSLAMDNFDAVGHCFNLRYIANAGDTKGNVTGKKWWTVVRSVVGDFHLAERRVDLPKQNTRAEIVTDALTTQQVTPTNCMPIGNRQDESGDIAFISLQHPAPVSVNDKMVCDGKFGMAKGKYWYSPVGWWGNITTASMVMRFPLIEVVTRHAPISDPARAFDEALYDADKMSRSDGYGDIPWATFTNTVLETTHRVNVTPYVPLLIDAYGRRETIDSAGVSHGVHIYVNARLDMDNAYNADIVDHCDLYIMPGRHTETGAKDADFENTDRGHTYGHRVNIPAYKSYWKGTTSLDEGSGRVDAINDATHFNLNIPEADLPQVSPTGEYSFYLKLYFKHGAEPVLDDEEAHPVYLALTPKGQADITTSIGDVPAVGATDGPAVYYNLQGQRLAAPSGVCIEVRGGQARKIAAQQ